MSLLCLPDDAPKASDGYYLRVFYPFMLAGDRYVMELEGLSPEERSTLFFETPPQGARWWQRLFDMLSERELMGVPRYFATPGHGERGVGGYEYVRASDFAKLRRFHEVVARLHGAQKHIPLVRGEDASGEVTRQELSLPRAATRLFCALLKLGRDEGEWVPLELCQRAKLILIDFRRESEAITDDSFALLQNVKEEILRDSERVGVLTNEEAGWLEVERGMLLEEAHKKVERLNRQLDERLERLEGELADFEKAVDSYLASAERLEAIAAARQAAARLQHNLQGLK